MIAEKFERAIVVAPGARAAQAHLLGEVAAVLEARDAALQAALAAGDATAARAILARPLRIVVPSGSLRDHVSAALLQHFGRSLAAVVVSTHRALALTVVERAGEAAPVGDELFRVLVKRFAAEDAVLHGALGAVDDGYALAFATARDLVDAGFAAAPAAALEDLLDEHAGPEAARARAVAQVTARALAELEKLGRAPGAALLQRAADLLRARGDALLPTAALWVHGFADATGVVGDWIEALQRSAGARVVVGVPPDPFAPGGVEAEFSKRFLERLGASSAARVPAEDAPAPTLALLRAPGGFAELRAVAQRIRTLLDDGVAPESIGVVARGLEGFRDALEANFARLAIPFSAPRAAPAPDLHARRLDAARMLLARGGGTAVDTWLAASLHADAGDGDLRVGLHVLGAARLSDLVQLDLAAVFAKRDVVVLPVRRGSVDEERDDEDATPSVRRVRSRVLHRDRLERAHARAVALVARLAAWPVFAAFAEHEALLAQLLETDLGWSRDHAALVPVRGALEALGDEVPPAFELDRTEFAGLVARALELAAGARLGGRGAGVQVLSVMSARGRCFEHLFAIGLNRDVFPRTPTEDPLVSDALRRALRDVLPELPVKADGRAEERHLFAELLSSSPRVTLSWQHVSDEGREVARSSFVAQLCLVRGDLAVAAAPPAIGAQRGDDALRPPHEHAVRAALFGPRAALAPIRRAALAEVGDLLGVRDGADTGALAAVQLAILDELDPDLRTRAGWQRSARLGPYFGYVGAAAQPAKEALYVTRLEAIARCPWQSFLRRELSLAPAPDALDALPALSPLVTGNTVHAILQRVVEREIPRCGRGDDALAAAFARGPVRIPWPDAAELASIAAEEAERVAADEGVRIAGFARALARRALRMVAVARACDWTDPAGLAVLGAELRGEVAVPGAGGHARRVGFRVDRADLADGVLRLTDYKTGKPVSDLKRAAARREKLLEAVQEGRALQGVAYFAGARALGATDTQGRLLFLRDDLPDDARAFATAHTDADLVAAFEATAQTLFATHDAGTLFPRLVVAGRDEEPSACDWCEVAMACLRGESGQRARLRRWADAASGRRAELGAGERALFATFAIGREAPEVAS